MAEEKPEFWRWTESNWKNPDIDWKDATYITIGIDVGSVSQNITPRTKAIIVVHYGGRPVEMEMLREVAGDLPIVEDAAHACGFPLAPFPEQDHSRIVSLNPSFPPPAHSESGVFARGGRYTPNWWPPDIATLERCNPSHVSAGVCRDVETLP